MGRFSKANREAMKQFEEFQALLEQRNIILDQQHGEALKLGRQGVSKTDIKKQLPGWSSTGKKHLERSRSGMGLARPEFYAEPVSRYLDQIKQLPKGDQPEAARLAGRNIQRPGLEVPSIRGPFNVGHHGQGLMSIFNALKQFPREFQHQVLDILETEFGFKFGDESINYLKNLAHKTDDITRLRKDWKQALGVNNLDDLNPSLKKILEPLTAHSKQFGSTTGTIPPELVKGMTDPLDVAKAIFPWLDQNQAGLEQGITTSNVIEKYGMKDGKIIKDNFKPGGIVEKELLKLQPTGTESVIKTGRPKSKLLRNQGLKIGVGSFMTTAAFSALNPQSGYAAGIATDALQKGDTETAKAQIKPFLKGVRDDLGWQAGLALAGGVAAKQATVKSIGGKILGGPVGWGLLAKGVYDTADAFTQGYSGRNIGDHLMEKTGYANLLKLERQVDNKGKVTYEKNAEAKAAKQRLFDVLRARQEKSNSEL
tara:strand:- start:28 stop:1473 length:1446 start_codon:yes stop_codon:yes gene_type:complete